MALILVAPPVQAASVPFQCPTQDFSAPWGPRGKRKYAFEQENAVFCDGPKGKASPGVLSQTDLVTDGPVLVQRGNGNGNGNGNGSGNGNGNGNGHGGGNSGGKGNSGGNGNSGSSGSGGSNKSSENPSPNSNSNPASGHQPSSYLGQVTVSAAGQVISGDVRIQSSSPWLGLAIPGMWLEATGVWEGEVFVAT